jgi:hypothetical protein
MQQNNAVFWLIVALVTFNYTQELRNATKMKPDFLLG